jgi:hypothetical protein
VSRAAYTPKVDDEKYPPILQLKSVHNTPIEGLWHWFQRAKGLNIKDLIRSGYLDGIYNPNHPIHPYVYVSPVIATPYSATHPSDLFNWLWPKILQIQLDSFVEYWNNHRIRSQPKKANMSGHTPRHAFTVSDSLGAPDCCIEVDREVLEVLRSQIPVSREESMRWVNKEFDIVASTAYRDLGEPELVLLSGWTIFSQLVPLIQHAFKFGSIGRT